MGVEAQGKIHRCEDRMGLFLDLSVFSLLVFVECQKNIKRKSAFNDIAMTSITLPKLILVWLFGIILIFSSTLQLFFLVIHFISEDTSPFNHLMNTKKLYFTRVNKDSELK